MASFDAGINLKVKVLDDQLNKLESRIEKISKRGIFGSGDSKQFQAAQKRQKQLEEAAATERRLAKARAESVDIANRGTLKKLKFEEQYRKELQSSIEEIRKRNRLIQQQEANRNQFPGGVNNPLPFTRAGQGKVRSSVDRLEAKRNEQLQQRQKLASTIAFQTKLELQFAQRLSGVEKLITKEQQKQIKAGQSLQKQKEKALKAAEREARLAERTAAAEKKKAQQAKGRKFQQAALGVGFPLLFGGGAGSIAGGAAGSAGGFGGQILGSSLGAQFDKFAQKSADLAKALDGAGGSVEALEALIGSLDSEVANALNNLEASGQLIAASELAFEQLAKAIGEDNARAIDKLGTGVNNTTSEFTKLATVLAAVTIRAFDFTKELSKLLPTLDPLGFVVGGILGNSEGKEVKDSPKVQQTTDDLRAQLSIQEAITAQDSKQAAILERDLEYAKIQRQLDEKSINDEQAKIKKKIVQLQLDEKLLDIEKQKSREAENQLKAQERARQAEARELERRQREAEAAFKKARQTEAAVKGAQVERLKADLAFATSLSTRELAIQAERANIQKIVDLQIEQLRLTTEDNRVLALKELTLLRQADTRDRILERELFALRVSERRLEIEKEIARQSQLTDIDRQIERIGIGTGPGSDEQLLALDQRIRREEALINSRKELAVIEDKLAALDPTRTDQEYTDLVRLRNEQIAFNQSLQTRLDLLDQAEQAQFRYNKVLEAATPFAEAFASGLTQGLRDVVAGTKTAEQAFADFLNNIADLLIQTAATMIAQYIAIGIARAFAGIPGGDYKMESGGLPFGGSGNAPSGLNTQIFGLRAAGGPTAKGSPYIVGENGTELFIPNVSGRIVPADDFDAARAAMGGGGGSDSSTVDGAFEASTSSVSSVRERLIQNEMQASSARYTNQPITFETMQIGNMDVVTREEAEAIGQASAQQARAQVFSDMRNRPAVRRQVGVK